MSSSGFPRAEFRPRTERSEEADVQRDLDLDPRVAARLEEIFQSGKVQRTDLDRRALSALSEFPVEGALSVLTQFVESNLQHVSNKSAFLCGTMKNYRHRFRVASGNFGSVGSNNSKGSPPVQNGPDDQKIQDILDRTGYTLEVTTGQRKYSGPPPGWNGSGPSHGCEVFCGRIPRDTYEYDLIPLFEKWGTIWDLRLMMDPLTNLNKGYAFVTYTTKEEAQEAVRQLDSYLIGDGKPLKVNLSQPKTGLFVGNIPKTLRREDIFRELQALTVDLKDVIYYSLPGDKNRNRGFCFLEYKSHKAASLAKRVLDAGQVKAWNSEIIVDWADAQEEPDDDVMSKVKVLYVKNLTAVVTEEKLREVFGAFGTLERVKKIKDYAFIHYEDRSNAMKAKEALNKKSVCDTQLDVSLAKPPPDKKKREDVLRKRELRMLKTLSSSMANAGLPQCIPHYGQMVVHRGYYESPVSCHNQREAYDHGMMWGWTGDGNWSSPQVPRGQWTGENFRGGRSNKFHYPNNSGGSYGTQFFHQGSLHGDLRPRENLSR